MVRKINSYRDNQNKSMSEMRSRRMRRNKGMSESKGYSYRKQLKETFTYPDGIADDLFNYVTDEFMYGNSKKNKYYPNTTTKDVQNFLDNEFDRIVQEYIKKAIQYKSDCFEIIKNADIYDWFDAKEIIGHIAETIEDLATYAILLIIRESDVYEKAKNYLIDRIENPEDYE